MAVAIAAVLVLLPFVGKPFHIDDPMYVWTARQIAAHPFDFYGFSVNWDGYERPVIAVMENPPLVPYLIAAAAAVVGWGETGLHAAFLPVAAATVVGVYLLATTFCRRPLAAALLVLACPGFLVSATTLMCDVPLLCLWVWATLAWLHVSATPGRRVWGLPVAGLLTSAALLAKYPGVNLVPLLALHALLFPAKRWSTRVAQAVSLSIPIIVLVAYDRLTAARYGHGLLSAAAGFASRSHAGPALPIVARVADAVAFAGGIGLGAAAVFVAVAAATPPGRWWRLAPVLAAWPGAAGVAAAFVPHSGTWSPATATIAAAAGLPRPTGALPAWLFDVEFGGLAAAGVAVAVLCIDDLARSTPGRDRRQGLFLVAWVAGVFTFAVGVNWAINARTLLPLVPPVCILACRAVDRSPTAVRSRAGRAAAVAGAAAFLVALAVTAADDSLARANRRAAVELAAWHEAAGPGRRLWFQGHWGFQYYMQQTGATPVDLAAVDLRPGDLLVEPVDNYGVGGTGVRGVVGHVVRCDAGAFVTTMNAAVGAGFYGSAGDLLPFAFGLVPLETFVVLAVQGPNAAAVLRTTPTSPRPGGRPQIERIQGTAAGLYGPYLKHDTPRCPAVRVLRPPAARPDPAPGVADRPRPPATAAWRSPPATFPTMVARFSTREQHMRAVVTGQVGVDKGPYLEAVAEQARRAGHDLAVCHVGRMMYAEAPDVPPGRILNLPITRLNTLRRSVFKEILRTADRHAHVIVNTHATFRWHHGLFSAFDFDHIKAFDADLYLTLLDNVESVHQRLARDHDLDHTLKDIMVWREEELLATEILANAIRGYGHFYMVSRGRNIPTTQTIYNLMFEPGKKKVYPSFPMSHVADLPDTLAQIDAFRAELARHFTTFDPGDVDEFLLHTAALKALAEGATTMVVRAADGPVTLKTAEVAQISGDIMGQIYARDFKMVDQSDLIVSLVPELPNGKPGLSSGVERELHHAFEGGKEVYVVWACRGTPSPFITETATRVFKSVDEAMGHFREKGYAK